MKQLKIIFTGFLLLILNYCLSAQITLSSQAEVDAWDQSITVLTEAVTITGPDITNIDALSNLTNVQTTLRIEGNAALTNIDGLSGLRQVTGEVNVIRNKALDSIDGLLGLTDIAGRIFIQFNDALTNIDGFSNLRNLVGRVSIWENDGLINVDGFSGIENFTGSITIKGNDILTSLEGLSGLTDFLGNIELIQNPNLTNLDVFSGITNLTGTLRIESNASLDDIDAFSDLTSISGALTLWNISGLSNVDVFTNLEDISGSLNIRNNEDLINIDGLSKLTVLNGRIFITANNALVTIDGLSNLKTIYGTLEIRANMALQNIDGLANLTELTGTIVIDDNDSLVNLRAFSDYTDSAGTLVIEDNDGLTNLDVFSSLRNITGSVTIKDNIALTNWNGIAGLEDIEGRLIITNNNGLINVNVFSDLVDFSGSIVISGNANLIDLRGFSSLQNITGRLDITNNDALENLDGFSALSVLDGGLYFTLNSSLTRVDGFPNLKSINGTLYFGRNDILENIDGLFNQTELNRESRFQIDENPSLTNIDGLLGIAKADGNIYIEENHSLTNIDGLSILTEISSSSDIRIINNKSLTNVDGLSNVKYVGRFLSILNNESLLNLNGLAAIESVSNFGELAIEGNPLLSSCCGIRNAIKNSDSNDIEVNNNDKNCNSVAEILDVCSLVLNFDQTRPCEGADNGRINFFASNFDTLPFSYFWEEISSGLSGSAVSRADIFSIDNLAPGSYSVTVTLPNGAQEIVPNIVLDPIVGSVFEITELTTTNSTNGSPSGSISIEYSGGTPPYNLTWTGPNSSSRTGITNTFFTAFSLSPGEYTLQLTDADNQSKLASITLLDEVVPIFPCTEPLDIIILNDVSGSVDAIEYEESKSFFVDFLGSANIGEGPMESQATIIEWSSGGQQSVMVPLSGVMQELSAYEDATRAFDQGTSPHPAMEFAADYIETNGRQDVEKVFILSTDGSPSNSLIFLADEYKAKGYHIVTIAFDHAYSLSSIRDILTQVASVPLLAPGAPAYSQLDTDLADNIVTRYLCPLSPGSASSVYFHRDGVIEIDSVEAACPADGLVDVTFTVSAKRELSIPSGTSVMFYHNDPLLFGATPILNYNLPCAIPTGTSESHTVTLPINGATKLYALLNDDGSLVPPLQFPITPIEEIAYSNNIDTISVCIDARPTIQALKYTSTPVPICDSILMYTIDVCNIGAADALGIVINDEAPQGSVLSGMTTNNNGCATDNGGVYDIPAGCCVSISLTYNATEVPIGYYGNQNVDIDGPMDQVYIDYDGSLSSAEDVMVGAEGENCPSTNIWFSKEVSEEELCDDGFLVYTYTIHNETNSVIHGARFTDVLPSPMEWVYKPYAMNGLSISSQQLTGITADFIIDEIPADTIATFQIDAYTGDWLLDGTVASAASLANVIDLENGGLQTIESNEVSTQVYASENFPCDSLWTKIKIIEPLSSVILFPNPSEGTIQFKSLRKPVKYKLFSYTGELYEQGEYKGGELQLDYEGINLVQLILEGRMKIFKVVNFGNSRQ